ECFVDLIKRHIVRDELVDLDLAVHVLLHITRQLTAAFHTTEGGAAPDTPGHQLERPRGNFFARTGHTDDDRFAPALVAALQRRAHHVDVADALERVIHTTVGQVDNHL